MLVNTFWQNGDRKDGKRLSYFSYILFLSAGHRLLTQLLYFLEENLRVLVQNSFEILHFLTWKSTLLCPLEGGFVNVVVQMTGGSPGSPSGMAADKCITMKPKHWLFTLFNVRVSVSRIWQERSRNGLCIIYVQARHGLINKEQIENVTVKKTFAGTDQKTSNRVVSWDISTGQRKVKDRINFNFSFSSFTEVC